MADHPIVGVWEVQASDAPFPWHVFTFTPFGTFSQSNPPAGNRDESDSAGHGIWEPLDNGRLRARFVEYKADHTTGEYVGKAIIDFQISVDGDTFSGQSAAYRYDTDGQVLRGPLPSPVSGRRLTFAGFNLGIE